MKQIFSSKIAYAIPGLSALSVPSVPLLPILMFLNLSCQSCFAFIGGGLRLKFFSSWQQSILKITEQQLNILSDVYNKINS